MAGSESPLHEVLRVVRGARRPKTGFFLRAESFFNVASEVERLEQSEPRGHLKKAIHGHAGGKVELARQHLGHVASRRHGSSREKQDDRNAG